MRRGRTSGKGVEPRRTRVYAGKVRKRRYLAVAARSAEGPFTMRGELYLPRPKELRPRQEMHRVQQYARRRGGGGGSAACDLTAGHRGGVAVDCRSRAGRCGTAAAERTRTRTSALRGDACAPAI